MVGLPCLLIALAVCSTTFAQTTLTNDQINNVRSRLAEAAKLSWELGTRAEALIELDTPSFSVFTPSSIPPPTTAPDTLSPALTIAQSVVKNLTNFATPEELIPGDGAAGDPVAIGIIVAIANWTKSGNLNYAGALQSQLEFLLEKVPRTANGAISHRVADAQLWSDFISMVPPFLAYYGVLTSNTTLITLAVQQISDYRDTLRDGQTGLWKHIVGNGEVPPDPQFWSTGNGWAAHGILRTIATIAHSPYAAQFQSERSEMAGWVKEIFNGMYKALGSDSYLFRNYVTDSSSFLDASGTTLLTASVYRAAIITGDKTWISTAEKARTQIIQSNIDSSGWLNPVVNPHEFGIQGNQSAEAQAFVLMMQAAYQRYTDVKGAAENGGIKSTTNFSIGLGVVLLIIAVTR